jgi:signal peptidase I
MENKENTELSETQVFERLTNPELETKQQEKKVEEPKPSKPEKEPSATDEVFSFIKDLVICMVAVFLLTNYVVRPVQVKGNSMYPTLEDGSLGVSNTLGYHTSEIKRFDIVIIYVPEKNEYLVKRVIALPGETVSYSNGQLYINGEAVEETFLSQEYVESYGSGWMPDISEVTMGDDEYYCLGDNRPHSTDSRYYGPFKKENIKSKGIFIAWPLNDFGTQTW